jgi:hypothetical protein
VFSPPGTTQPFIAALNVSSSPTWSEGYGK